MKKWIHAKSKTAKSDIIDLGKVIIDIELPLSAIQASKALNQDRFISIDMLREDVADILKDKYGFVILKETDQYRKNSDGSFVETEGHASSNRNSLSLYYTVRYDMGLSDQLPHSDNFTFAETHPAITCDIVLRITDHKFDRDASEADTQRYDKQNLQFLKDQLNSEPQFKLMPRREIALPSTIKIKHKYLEGLEEFEQDLIATINQWRREVKGLLH